MATSNAPARRPNPADEGQRESARSMLEKSASRLDKVLPKHLTPERMIQVASTMIYRTQGLQKCDQATVVAAVIRAGSLGLDLDPKLNEAFLVPYGSECNFQLGYAGLLKLAMQSGQFRYIRSEIVYEGDQYRVRYTPGLEFLHDRARPSSRGAPEQVYAHARLVNGEDLVEDMTWEDVEKIRKLSPNSAAWRDFEGEMAKKSILKRFCKRLPRSTELAVAMSWDSDIYDIPKVEPGEAPKPTRGLAAVHRHLKIGAQPGPEPVFEPVFEPGVDKPLRSEADESDFYPDDDEQAEVIEALPAGRMPGED